MSDFGKLAHLKEILFGMERDLGIESLGQVQKDIVYAATILSEASAEIETDDIRKHQLLSGVGRSTFFRALKEVVELGYLKHSEGAQRSRYKLAGAARPSS